MSLRGPVAPRNASVALHKQNIAGAPEAATCDTERRHSVPERRQPVGVLLGELEELRRAPVGECPVRLHVGHCTSRGTRVWESAELRQGTRRTGGVVEEVLVAQLEGTVPQSPH